MKQKQIHTQKKSNAFLSLFLIFTSLMATPQAKAADPWKGHTDVSPIEVGLMSGLSLYGKDANWSVLASGAYLILPQGWAQDLDNRVWLEVEGGPAFFGVNGHNSTGFQYSAHLRWDFTYNEYWTLYGLGGLGGFILPNVLGSSFTIHPRFGAGVEYQTKTPLMFRGEVSQDFFGLGIALNF